MSLYGGLGSRGRRRKSPLIGFLSFLVTMMVFYAVTLIFVFAVRYAFASSKTTEGTTKPSIQVTVNVPATPKVSETSPTVSKPATKATPHKNVAKTTETISHLKAQIASLLAQIALMQKQLTDAQSNLEVSKSVDSPSGTLVRGTFVTVAKYDLNSNGANQGLSLSDITFTSTVGFPSALTSSVGGIQNDAALFRLYDVDNGVAVPAAGFLNVTNGTIAFTGITPVAFPAVVYGQTRHLALQATTTNQALWPEGTLLRFTAQPSFAYSYTTGKG